MWVFPGLDFSFSFLVHFFSLLNSSQDLFADQEFRNKEAVIESIDHYRRMIQQDRSARKKNSSLIEGGPDQRAREKGNDHCLDVDEG